MRLTFVLLLTGCTATAWATDTELLPPGAIWSYDDDGAEDLGWQSSFFDDSAWPTGPAQLGYGDGDEDTTVSYGDDPWAKHTTTWFRRTVSVPDATAFNTLKWRLLRDDGAIVYLNGVEQFRDNMPPWASSMTLASADVDGADEDAYREFLVPSTQLLTGDNVVAIEVHQFARDSEDLSFDLELVASDLPFVSRGPYLNQNTSDGIVVKWRTSSPTDTVLEIGPAPGALSIAHNDAALVIDHEVQLTGLSPDTLYHYAVGTSGIRLAGDDAAHSFRTAPLPGTPRPSRFWIVGDSGTANISAEMVRDAFWTFTGPTDPDLFVMLGDNAYGSGTDVEYQRAVFDMYPDTLARVPLWSTLGNHDGYTADSATMTGPYYDIFTFPMAGEAGGVPSGTEAYYSFDYANVHFICLDSYDSDRSVGSPMLTWLESDLQATDQDWVIAFWHHPPYSKGSHNSDSELQLVEMRTNALPILEDYGVDLVFAGHSHSYERSYLIDGHYGDSDSFDAAVHGLDMGDGSEAGTGAYRKLSPGAAPHEGAVYVVAGSSGSVSGGTLDHEAMHISLRELGSVVLDVDENRLDAWFLDETAATLDRFTLVKGCNGGTHDDDADGLCSDRDNCPWTNNFDQVDTDGDGRGDACDVCGDDPGNDADIDGICADVDNCPDNGNPTQVDSDMDGTGDACDPCTDADFDGVCGQHDVCPEAFDPAQADTDGDGRGDVCDPCIADPDDDLDRDGICGDVDVCPTVPDVDQADADGDGRGDSCDRCPGDPLDDHDGDGICAGSDNCPYAYNTDQADRDRDGTGDACDVCTDVDDDGRCEGDDRDGRGKERSCGCDSGPGGGGVVALALALALVRRPSRRR